MNGRSPSLAARTAIATALLIILGGLVAPSTVSKSAIMSMLPLAAILAVASIGQHLVIQQRGLDLSVAGFMSLAAVMVTALPASNAGIAETLAYVGLALLMGLVVGAVNGVLIALLEVPALVTTIGMNALLFGATIYLSSGSAYPVPPPLDWFGLNKWLEIPLALWVMVAIGGFAIFVLARAGVGRRFVASSVNPAAAVAVGIRLNVYRLATYILAGLSYAAAGVMLAAYFQTPTVLSGLPYLLGSVATVVVGGNPIEGGRRGSLAATIIAAFFLTYLGQLVLAFGFGVAHRNLVEAFIIVIAIALPDAMRRARLAIG